MSRLARIAVLAGDTPGARAVAGAVTSLLTAVGRWVEGLPAGAALAPYTAVILPRSRGWRAVRERPAGPLLVVGADLPRWRGGPGAAAIRPPRPSGYALLHRRRPGSPRRHGARL